MQKQTRIIIIFFVLLIISGYFFYREIYEGYKLRGNKVTAKLLLAKEANYFKVYFEDSDKHPDRFIKIPAIRIINKEEWDLTVEATGTKNPNSSSDEVWIFNITTPDDTLKWRDVQFLNKPWNFITAPNGAQGTAVYACCNNPKSFNTKIYGGTLILSFRNYSWDGIVHIKAQHIDTLIDLYSPSLRWKREYYFQPLVDREDSIATYAFEVPVAASKTLSFVAPGNASLLIDELKVNSIKPDSLGTTNLELPARGYHHLHFVL